MSGEVLAGGLRCGEVLARLSDYLDDALPAEERARVEAHLRACGRCEAFGGRVGRIVRDLRRELGAPEPLPEGLKARLLDGLEPGRE